MLELSIAIPAYNEEENIERTLRLLLAQDISSLPVHLKEIIVVSDGSTDRTDEIVQKITREFPVVQLVRMEERSGKSAVVNRILGLVNTDVLAMFDSDTFTEPNCLRYLLEPLLYQPDIVGTSGRKIPYNRAIMPDAFWEVCHYFNLIAPKMSGSAMAFRNIVKTLPSNIVNDDMYIQIELERQGFKVAYIPQAIVKTVEPDTLSGYFRQRKRVYRGHLQLFKEENIRLPSVGMTVPAKALFKAIKACPRKTFIFTLCSFLEIVIRVWALVEYYLSKRAPFVYPRSSRQ